MSRKCLFEPIAEGSEETDRAGNSVSTSETTVPFSRSTDNITIILQHLGHFLTSSLELADRDADIAVASPVFSRKPDVSATTAIIERSYM